MKIRSALLAASMVTCAHPAWAQERAEAEAEDIVVTGVRQAYLGEFEEREVPRAIAVIDDETLEDNNVTRLTDALDLSASVARQNNFGGLWDAFAVRGFAGDENLPSGYLVNGFNGGRGFGGPRDVSGIERIEVLKGPNAALYGRGEPGGTVNIVTKRALFGETLGNISASYGSFDSFRTDGDLNLALGEAFAVRLIGFYESADSFRDTVESERWGVSPSIAARLGPNTTLAYDLERVRQEMPFDRGIVAPNGQLAAFSASRATAPPRPKRPAISCSCSTTSVRSGACSSAAATARRASKASPPNPSSPPRGRSCSSTGAHSRASAATATTTPSMRCCGPSWPVISSWAGCATGC
jgi:iron complex outermembrane receptor protein